MADLGQGETAVGRGILLLVGLHEAPGGSTGVNAAVDDVDAVDEHVLDAERQLVGILEGGAVADGLRGEDDDIGQHAATQEATVAQTDAIGDGRALVVTLDFFAPLVDDPYAFGRIAAANALSDIYAMGAQPLFVLNLLAFPRAFLGDGLVAEIIRGGSDIAREAGGSRV